MAKTAFAALQEQIEAVRREAFAAGFNAAMRAVSEFAAKAAPALVPAAGSRQREIRVATATLRLLIEREPDLQGHLILRDLVALNGPAGLHDLKPAQTTQCF